MKLALLAVLALSPAVSAQQAPGFVRSKTETLPPPTLQIALSQTASFSCSGSILRRRIDGHEIALPCATPGGPGQIRALTRAPGEMIWLAADNGLFLADTSQPEFDAPTLKDGIPKGKPVGLHMDAKQRLWVATDQAFGAVHPTQLFGRTFRSADGIPPPPYTGLAPTSDGNGLLLQTKDGIYEYRPDQGPAPTGTLSQEQGNDTVTGTADGTAQVNLQGAATGGPSFRFRRKHHHILYPTDGSLFGYKPGNHGLDVFVFDRDLNQARVARTTIHIPFPRTFDKRILLPVAGGGLIAVFALFLLGAKRRGGRRGRYLTALLSAGLLCIVGLQVLAGFLGYGRGWPFVGFTMYSKAAAANSALYKPHVVGIWPNGRQRKISLAEAGLAQDGYWQILAEVLHGDATERNRIVDGYNRRHPQDPMLGFRIIDTRIRLTQRGPAHVPPLLMLEHRKK